MYLTINHQIQIGQALDLFSIALSKMQENPDLADDDDIDTSFSAIDTLNSMLDEDFIINCITEAENYILQYQYINDPVLNLYDFGEYLVTKYRQQRLEGEI